MKTATNIPTPARVIALNIFPCGFTGDTTYEFCLDDFSTITTSDVQMFVKTGWVTAEDLKQTRRYSFETKPVPVMVKRGKRGKLVFGAVPRNPDSALVFARACDDLMAYIQRSETPAYIAAKLLEALYVA